MRIAVTIGVSTKGILQVLTKKGWMEIGPALSYDEQAAAVKTLTLTGGREKAADKAPLLASAHILTTSRAAKRRKFDPQMPERLARIREEAAKALADRKKVAPQDFIVAKKPGPEDEIAAMPVVKLVAWAKGNGIAIPRPLLVDMGVEPIRLLVRKALAEKKAAKKAE